MIAPEAPSLASVRCFAVIRFSRNCIQYNTIILISVNLTEIERIAAVILATILVVFSCLTVFTVKSSFVFLFLLSDELQRLLH